MKSIYENLKELTDVDEILEKYKEIKLDIRHTKENIEYEYKSLMKAKKYLKQAQKSYKYYKGKLGYFEKKYEKEIVAGKL